MTQLVLFVCLMVVFTTVVFIPAEAVSAWFGTNQMYMCHCEKNECTPKGECKPNHRCKRGWFGPECQYTDLAVKTKYSKTSMEYIVTDGKDDTCVTENTGSVTITLDKDYPFTWMRVHTKKETTCVNDSIKMLPSEPTGCIKVNGPLGFFDFYCDSPGAVRKITLSGPCTKLLCSVNVSGGRNVALKQKAKQNGDYNENNNIFGPSLSVDGDTNGNFYKYKTCSHTNVKPLPEHWWNVSFTYPVKILRYVIYNRNDSMSMKTRIKGFQLETKDKKGNVIFKYADKNKEAQDVYEIMGLPNSTPAVATTIKKLNTNLLHFCEMEIYGDTVCNEGVYGKECELRCSSNCAGNVCFPSTGACRLGCRHGFTGISCQKSIRPECSA